jgi:hypothetical protein
MNPSTFAVLEGFHSHEVRKKRLGQYFSGLPVSKLLVALSAHRKIQSVCDPMAGRADILLAAHEVISGCNRTDGIEIDPIAHGEGAARLHSVGANSVYLLGSAFDPAILSMLATDGYDLVATNPPYVRYQLQKTSAGQAVKLPSALEVRNGLRQCLNCLTTLSDRDRQDFLTLVESYSGLSDLAVPSWILCAALVKLGGTLAMVLPEAWLNRDYATVVRYLLLRWFRIEYIVEDAHAAWFSDAQVKTTLLVAQRIDRLASISKWTNQTYLHVSLPSSLGNGSSLVGRTAVGSKFQPELAFATEALRVATGVSESLFGATWHRVRIADQVAVVTHSSHRERWFQQVEQHTSVTVFTRYIVPPVLTSWFDGYEGLTTLGELGVEIGQGLRTGANDFFYAEVVSHTGSETIISSSLFRGERIALPTACVLPVVRKQSDICGMMSVNHAHLTGVVLTFHGWALPEDASVADAKELPSAVATYIRRAASAKVRNKALPSLTAVAPNVRKANLRMGVPARFWYMLPDFAPRHRPDLFIARINSEMPRVVLNPGRNALIDANFSTLWMKPDAPVDGLAVFAYLNSSIATALFEHTGAVMGGGALKLEATHLRSLPVPALPKKAWCRLACLGSQLAQSAPNQRNVIVQKIDDVLCTAMFGADRTVAKVMYLHGVIQKKQAMRAKNGVVLSL